MKGPFVLFLAVLALWPTAFSAAQKECPAPFRGRYINEDHGYSFTVPKDYSGQWQSPCTYSEQQRDCICMGSHGLYIAITKNAGVNVVSFFSVELDEEKPSQTRILASMVAQQQEGAKELGATFFKVESVLIKANWARRISVRWIDNESKKAMTKVSYQFVTHVYRSQWPSAELTVSLIAPEDEFETRLPLLNEILESFKWLL